MQAVVEFLKAISDPTRLRIVKLLQANELAVCEIAFIMDVTQPTVSQHLRRLERLGLILERREGAVRYCTLDADMLRQMLAQVQTVFSAEADSIADMQEPIVRLAQVKQSDPLRVCKLSNCQER